MEGKGNLEVDQTQETIDPQTLSRHSQHESYHSFLLILIFILLIGSQIGLYLWRKHRYRSFINVTLVGLWIIPLLMAIALRFIRFICIWTVFSIFTLYIIVIASKTPLDQRTPKRVYSWFFFNYRACYGAASFGYLLFMLDFFGVSHFISAVFFNIPHLAYAGVLMIFYGLYFGVLGRDCAEVCTDRLASTMGFTGKGLPMKSLGVGICSICGERYTDHDSFTLDCQHKFHDSCIRGWTMIGKKDTCPFCSEKVQLQKLFKNPWEKQGILWAQLLDSLRYLLVWNPVILIGIQVILYYLD